MFCAGINAAIQCSRLFLLSVLFLTLASCGVAMNAKDKDTEAPKGISKGEYKGTWRGQGTSADSTGVEKDCSTVTFEIEQTKTWLSIKKGEFYCGGEHPERWPQIEAEVRGNNLVRNGEAIGKISESTISVNQVDSQGASWIATIVLGRGVLKITEKYVKGDFEINREAVLRH